MRLFLLAVFVLWIAPVKMGAAVHWQEGVHARLALGVTCWGVRFSKQYLKPYPSGRLEKHSEEHADSEALLVEGKAEKGDAADSSGLRMLMRVLKTVLIGNRARQYFRRTSHTEGLYLVLYTGTRDAAACALADAGIKTDALNDGSGVEALDLGVGVEFVEVAHTQSKVGVGKEFDGLGLLEFHEEHGDAFGAGG